ncbi:MAG: hypothetical protein E8D41_00790 [Nitrospira sp.]|nr:MAG: hypothetical protein E8D41_00790 [Nitrospira sp.]
MTNRLMILIVLLSGQLLLTGCVSFAETPGERFRQAIKEIEAACAKRKLDSNEVCGGVAKLKPADPLATEEGRFAHSIKIPNPVPEHSGYKPGMTPEQYFDHLCKTEAGEFIYRTVENVEGLYLMRPRERVTDDHLKHLYALEDIFGYSDIESEAPQQLFINPPWRNYKYFEVPLDQNNLARTSTVKYRRYFGRVQGKRPMTDEVISSLKSQYGYTWRGVTRQQDRELGIVGGELIVLDLQTIEVLAVRRGYIRSEEVRNSLTGIWWLGGHVCPIYRDGHIYTYEFISKVLKPAIVSGSEGGSNAAK